MNEFIVSQEDAGARLDNYLLEKLKAEKEGFTRSHAQKMISQGLVTVGGNIPKAGLKLKRGDHIFVDEEEPEELENVR